MITMHPDPSKTYFVFQVYGLGSTLPNLTAAEKELVKFKDSDVNSVDVFFVDKMYDTEDETDGFGGLAYSAHSNGTGNSAYQNFFIIAANANPTRVPPWPDSITFVHEMLHILLDTGHHEPDQAIIDADATNTFAVNGPKRIGPFQTDTAGNGDGHTTKLRNSAKQLP